MWLIVSGALGIGVQYSELIDECSQHVDLSHTMACTFKLFSFVEEKSLAIFAVSLLLLVAARIKTCLLTRPLTSTKWHLYLVYISLFLRDSHSAGALVLCVRVSARLFFLPHIIAARRRARLREEAITGRR